MTPLRFEIPGEPRPWGRPRFRQLKTQSGKAFLQSYVDRDTAVYENLVALCAREAIAGRPGFPIDGPIELRVEFRLRRPKKPRHLAPVGRPDTDNLLKGILDGCSRAGIWTDDARVCDIQARKVYGEPGATVEIVPARVLL